MPQRFFLLELGMKMANMQSQELRLFIVLFN